jgi:hypothetical protein
MEPDSKDYKFLLKMAETIDNHRKDSDKKISEFESRVNELIGLFQTRLSMVEDIIVDKNPTDIKIVMDKSASEASMLTTRKIIEGVIVNSCKTFGVREIKVNIKL